MAVRDDFAPGEVLTAGDLNDTFASKADASAVTGSNLLYNGAMQVAQRGTSTASITSGGYYTADRFNISLLTLGTWTQSIENDAPTGSGLRKSVKMLCTAADASPAAGDLLQFGQQIEGQDVQRIAKGTASAQQLTLSFWVKSNLTGTYVAYLFDTDNNRTVSASYTINSAAAWERKTITFPADTTGVLDNDNASSLVVRFGLGAGSNYTSGSLQTSWGALTIANLLVGQTNLAAATNNYWQITGVQLEVGPVATRFEFKSFGQELAECQRYYFKTFPQSTAPAQNTGVTKGAVVLPINTGASATLMWTELAWPVTLRTDSPVVTTFNPQGANANWRNSANTADYTVTVSSESDRNVQLRAANVAAGQGGYLHVTASAEL